MKSLCLLIMLYSSAVLAQLDYQAYGSLRSYPLSGTLSALGGYSQTLWGEPGGEKNPWFGYVRGEVLADTAVFYNSFSARLEFFPVSILGLTGGATWTNNEKEYTAYDCVTYECKGHISSQYFEGTLILGALGVFLVTKYKVEDFFQFENSRDFVEVNTGLAAQRGRDHLYTIRGALGRHITPEWTLVGMYVYNQMERSPGIGRIATLNVIHRMGPWRFLVGAGQFESPLAPAGFTIQGRITWLGVPSIGLF